MRLLLEISQTFLIYFHAACDSHQRPLSDKNEKEAIILAWF